MLTFSQSSTFIVPSGRSAMICNVVPWVDEIFTRTSRKPRSSRTGAAIAATRAANVPPPRTFDDFVILPEIISKEPLGPVVRHGDHQFADIVRWALYAMIEAEELGLTSKNVDQQAGNPNPAVQRFTQERLRANIDQGAFLGARVLGEGEARRRLAAHDGRADGEHASAERGGEVAGVAEHRDEGADGGRRECEGDEYHGDRKAGGDGHGRDCESEEETGEPRQRRLSQRTTPNPFEIHLEAGGEEEEAQPEGAQALLQFRGRRQAKVERPHHAEIGTDGEVARRLIHRQWPSLAQGLDGFGQLQRRLLLIWIE